jgi:hypothetical protein
MKVRGVDAQVQILGAQPALLAAAPAVNNLYQHEKLAA